MSAPTLPPVEVDDTRILPTPGDETAWADPATVAAIAGVALSDAERAAEVTWWRRDREPINWGWPQ